MPMPRDRDDLLDRLASVARQRDELARVLEMLLPFAREVASASKVVARAETLLRTNRL